MPDLHAAPATLSLPDAGGDASFAFLPHDTEIFGVPCYRFAGQVQPDGNGAVSAADTARGCEVMLTMKVEAGELPRWQGVLDRNGFSFIDTELTLSGTLVREHRRPLPDGVGFSDDAALVSALAPDLFRDLHSRFRLDAHLAPGQVTTFWNRYLADMVASGRAWALFPMAQGRPVGVCLFAGNRDGAKALDIQLIALEPQVRGAGLASALLAHAVAMTGITAGGTEVYAGARDAMNFYLRNGLVRVGGVAHVFHAWLPRTNG